MKYYAVKNGRKTGIFTDWESCRAQVEGYSGAKYKSFAEKSAAEAYLKGEAALEAEITTAYVDGSFNAESGVYGFGAVLLENGGISEYNGSFSDREMASMRNVAGEIEGAKFVMRYCVEKGITRVKIVYDYVGIEAWATGEWRTNKKGTLEYKKYYDSIKDTLFVQFEKVKGHSGNKYNDMADALAKTAVELQKTAPKADM